MSQQMRIDQFYKSISQKSRNDTCKTENTKPNLKGASGNMIGDEKLRRHPKCTKLSLNSTSQLSSPVNGRKNSQTNRRTKSISLSNGFSPDTPLSFPARNLRRTLLSRRFTGEIDLTQSDEECPNVVSPATPSKYPKRNASPGKAAEGFELSENMGSLEAIGSSSRKRAGDAFLSPKKKSPKITKTSPINASPSEATGGFELSEDMGSPETIEFSPRKRTGNALASPKKKSPKITKTSPINASPSEATEGFELSEDMGSSETIESSPRKRDSNALTSPKKKSPKITKTSPIKYLKHRSPKRRLFENQRIDTESACQAIENLNLARQGEIGPNNFDLQELYSSGDFDFFFPCMSEDTPTKYQVKDVVIPDDKHADHLFMIIVDVFVNPVNCGYFNAEELDFVFSMLTLSAEAQMLLARLLKRKHFWHRTAQINYPEIGLDLQPYFKELEKREFLTSCIDNEKLEVLLELLRAEEVRKICQASKVDHRGSKATTSEQLLKMASSTKALFPGMDTPYNAVRKKVSRLLGYSIRLPEKVINIVERLVMLLIPSQDVLTKLADTFLTLTMVHDGSMQYPELPKERHPIFRNREHLLHYVESKNALREATEARENKNWTLLLQLGRIARKRVTSLLLELPTRKEEPAVPSHVKKFTEEYMWLKVLTTSFEAFKKEKDTIPELVDALTFLLSQKGYLQGRKGQWYEELALIEMHHNKDLQAAARLTIEALSQENLSEVHMEGLFQRAEKLIRRRAVSSETKSLLKDLIKRPELQTITVTIESSVMDGNLPGRKSTWSVDMGEGDKGYMSVEQRAIHHYKQLGYTHGLHCEGALPLTLFTLVLWEELYSIPVPAAFLSPYQHAPLDLFTRQFYTNRKQRIDDKLDQLRSLDVDSLCEEIANAFQMRQHYISLMPTALFADSQRLKEIAQCLGTNGIVGICERLVKNFVLCRSGFPDLVVWNPIELKCKIVEVKGPGDTLSTKQTVWLQYLEGLGISTELCNVKIKGTQQRRKRSA